MLADISMLLFLLTLLLAFSHTSSAKAYEVKYGRSCPGGWVGVKKFTEKFGRSIQFNNSNGSNIDNIVYAKVTGRHLDLSSQDMKDYRTRQELKVIAF